MSIFGGRDDDESGSMFGSMFGGRSGSWGFYSKKDPRWNVNGSTKCLLVTGGYPEEAQTALDKLKKKYGTPPDDLEYSCMKD
jgi:hypothetical protein